MNNQEKLEKARNERLGEINKNTFGTEMKIIEYNNTKNVIVEFQDEYKYQKKCEYRQFSIGQVKNPYDKEVCNIGYLGLGENNRIKNKEEYHHWRNILKRCYDPYYLNKFPTYINCFVENHLHNFQNFVEWYKENYYEVLNEKMHIDKDILEKGNKLYDREHMIFVPESINTLFVKCNKTRGDLPIGCSLDKKNNKIRVNCDVFGKQVYLGSFPLDKPFQAFYTYKIFKENHIKQVADKYKDLIPLKLYEAMYRYEVEIND